MTQEIWKRVPGSPEFEASTHGRIRRKLTERVKKPTVRSDGKLMVNLRNGQQSRTRYVHTIIAETFIGPRAAANIVCFKDENPENCRVENLYYEKRSARVPLFPPALATLSPDDVARIRYLLDHRVPSVVVAGAFGVSTSLISKIKNKKKWNN